MHSQDGYKLISAKELVVALDALNGRQITFRAFRVFIGCFELLAIREAAERSNERGGKRRRRRFLRSELTQLINAKAKVLQGVEVRTDISTLTSSCS